MKVRELIELLKELDQEKEIEYEDAEYGDGLSIEKVELHEYKKNYPRDKTIPRICYIIS
jgi:hypothetical protein